jgi:hypothetical protein
MAAAPHFPHRRIPRLVRGRKRRRARKQTEQALLKLAEGDYQQVEKLMAKNADHAEQPVVNYLLAAKRPSSVAMKPAPISIWSARSRPATTDTGRNHPRTPAAGA